MCDLFLNGSIDYFSTVHNTFSFLHHNIRSYTHNFDYFSRILKDINEKIDIYMFSVELGFIVKIKFPCQTSLAFILRVVIKKGGGVSAYVKTVTKLVVKYQNFRVYAELLRYVQLTSPEASI